MARSEPELVCSSSVLVCALSAVPHCQVERYCGLVTVHMIKETVNVTRQFESLQVFYHQFVAEALLTAKARVLAVGGDALLGYRINNLFLREDTRRAYAVISISGDAAKLSSEPR
uniref:C2CD5 C-terminal domain-containing protein n=1 Tax=Pyrodinium bahamense TaxID=73915 RepID=A0A7S0FG36_9DINO